MEDIIEPTLNNVLMILSDLCCVQVDSPRGLDDGLHVPLLPVNDLPVLCDLIPEPWISDGGERGGER